MAESPHDSDSVGSRSTPEDSSLTIRIPKPDERAKFQATQSQWKGQRGKPRCDLCRQHNLKCDRVHPTCNQCAFTPGKECRYTPLPTPAHRGIPRCDRCRTENLKCDRTLPTCGSCAQDPDAKCNYTPKRRRRVPPEGAAQPWALAQPLEGVAFGAPSSSTSTFAVAPSPQNDATMVSDDEYASEGGIYSSDGEDVVRAPRPGPSATHQDPARALRPVAPAPAATSASAGPRPAPRVHPPAASSSRSYLLDPGIVLTPPQIVPWLHPAFAPLPAYLLQRLAELNAIEMPARTAFDDALTRFVKDLAPELACVAAFPPERYAELSRHIVEGTETALPNRMFVWVRTHHVQSGSEKTNRLVLLRESYFHLRETEITRLLQSYIAHGDREDLSASGKARARDQEELTAEWAKPYERLPVQTQVFDILSYAHRNHNSSASMLKECRRIGFATITWPIAEIYVRLCPLCNLRSRGQPHPQQMPHPAIHIR